MIAAALLTLAAKENAIGSGAVLTLVVPLLLLAVALGLWVVAFQRASRR